MIKKLLSILLFLIIIFVTLFLNKKLENLQNMGSGIESDDITIRGTIPYLSMHQILKSDPEGSPGYAANFIGKLNTPPYSFTDFSANLEDEAIQKDFAYFNNSTNIVAGRVHKNNNVHPKTFFDNKNRFIESPKKKNGKKWKKWKKWVRVKKAIKKIFKR